MKESVSGGSPKHAIAVKDKKICKVSSEKEKEKTKIRERHRRSITTNILTGLRKYGNYNLPPRADINDVLKALATEAGWIVERDGTTYKNLALDPGRSSLTLPMKPSFPSSNEYISEFTPSNTLTVSDSLTPLSVTPSPSATSCSLNNLGSLNYIPISTGGDSSTTASPSHINNSPMNLLDQNISPFMSPGNVVAQNMELTAPSLLDGISRNYVFHEDTDNMGMIKYDSASVTELLLGRNSGHPSMPNLTGLQSYWNPGLYSGQMGQIMEYHSTTAVPSGSTYSHPPFLQESRASNHNTPIGSPQHHSGKF